MDQVKQMRSTLEGLPRRAQLLITGIIVVTVLVLLVIVRSATHTTWVTVQSGLQPAAADTAQKTLAAANVQTQLIDNATTLQVPKDQTNAAQAALGTAHIAGRGGHSDCNSAFGPDSKPSMVGGTSAQTAMKEQTCLQNDIANKIEGLKGAGIQTASVTLVTSDNQLFSSEENPATASITLDTGGNQLTNSQVHAIAAIASGAVKNLAPEDVNIVDESGKLLSDPSQGDGTMTESQLKLRVEALYNQQLEAKLTHDFEKIVGVGNVTVSSRAELDMDKIKREIKQYGGEQGKQGPAETSATDVELLRGKGTTAGGVAGTPSNIAQDPTYTATTTGTTGADNNYSHEKNTTKYNNDAVAEAIDVAQGRNIGDNLAVTVDSSVSDDAANAVKNNAQALIGGDANDSFNFAKVNIPEPADLAKAAAASNRRAMLGSYIKWAILGLGLIGGALFLRRTLNQRTYELLNPGDDILLLESGLEPVPLRELEAALANATTMDNQKRLELQRKVEQIAVSKPNDVAQQLRGWLHETDYSGNRR